jgi:RNA polymerase sigma-70 factor, ECF subfamily
VTLTSADVTAALPDLFGYALSLTRDRGDAEDLVQDTVVRALERADTFRGDASARTWLHRIMHHRFVDLTRRRPLVSMDPEDIAVAVDQRWREDSYTVDPQVVALRLEREDDLRDALVHLPVYYRSAVLLHDLEGFTASQVADIHDISLPAAKQRIRRGRMLLVDQLAHGAQRHLQHSGVPLRCWVARERVIDYLDGDLDEAERHTLERHLGGCPTCPPLIAALVDTQAGIERLRDPDSVLSPDLAQRVRDLLAGVPDDPGPR